MTEVLYIGNATRQNHNFTYCLAKGSVYRELPIPPGTQARIPGELSAAQVDYIVTKQAKYGIVAADSIDQAQGFHGLCYSINKPIAGMRLTLLMDHNIGQLAKLGRQIREQTAVAQNTMLEQALIENGRQERITELDITVQQEHADPKNDQPQFSEGFRVIRGGADAPTPRRGKGRRAA